MTIEWTDDQVRRLSKEMAERSIPSGEEGWHDAVRLLIDLTGQTPPDPCVEAAWLVWQATMPAFTRATFDQHRRSNPNSYASQLVAAFRAHGPEICNLLDNAKEGEA